METIYKRCPLCGKITTMEISDEVNQQYIQYAHGVGFIQDISASADVREFLKTGICLPCQKMFFDEDDE